MTAKEFISGIPEVFWQLFVSIWRDVILPNLKYLKYVLRHKWFVFVACWQFAIEYRDVRLVWRGIVHDLSKFRPSEWFPYVNYFNRDFPSWNDPIIQSLKYANIYPKTKEEVEAAFDVAWNHHQKRNDHHPQYWLLRNDDSTEKVLNMPLVCTLEMLADWKGAGRAQGKPDTKAWYLDNKNKIPLHPNTRVWVEIELEKTA